MPRVLLALALCTLAAAVDPLTELCDHHTNTTCMLGAYTMLQKALTSGRPVVLGRTSCGAEACLSVAAIQRHDLSHICGDIHGKSRL